MTHFSDYQFNKQAPIRTLCLSPCHNGNDNGCVFRKEVGCSI